MKTESICFLPNHLTKISLTPIEQLYLFKQKTALFYQIIFITLGILFITFASILTFKIAHWSFHVLYFHGEIHTLILKVISVLSAIFGLISLGIGCSLRAEKETARSIYSKARNQLLYLPPSHTNQNKLEQALLHYEKMILILHQIAACQQTKHSQKKKLYLEALNQFDYDIQKLLS